MKLRNRLKHWRHQHEMNQREFARYLGVNHTQYNRWELQATQPGLETAWDLCKKLGITIEQLFEEASE